MYNDPNVSGLARVFSLPCFPMGCTNMDQWKIILPIKPHHYGYCHVCYIMWVEYETILYPLPYIKPLKNIKLAYTNY